MEDDFTDGIVISEVGNTTPMSSTSKNDSTTLASLPSESDPEHNRQIITPASNEYSKLDKSIEYGRKKNFSKSRGTKTGISESHRDPFHDKVPQVCPLCEDKPAWNKATRIQHKSHSPLVTYDNEKIVTSQIAHQAKKKLYSIRRAVLNSPNQKTISLKTTKLKTSIPASNKEPLLTQTPHLPKNHHYEVTQALPEKLSADSIGPNDEHNTVQDAIKIDFSEMESTPTVSSSVSSSPNEVDSSCNEIQYCAQNGTNCALPDAIESPLQTLDRNRLSNRNSKSSIVKTPKLEEDKPNTSYASDIEKKISEVLSCSSKDSKSDQIIEHSKVALEENVIIAQQPVDPSEGQNNFIYSLVDEILIQFPELAVIRETWEQLYDASHGIVKDDSESLFESTEKNEILSEASLNCEEVIKENTAYFSGNENQYYAQSGTNYALHDVIESPVETIDRNRLSNRNSKSSIVKTPKLEDDKPNTSYVRDIEKEISEVLSCSSKDSKSDQIIELSKVALEENVIIAQQPVNPSEAQNNFIHSLVDEILLQFPELAAIRETWEQLYDASHGIVKDDSESLFDSAEKNEILSEASLNCEEVTKEDTACFSGNENQYYAQSGTNYALHDVIESPVETIDRNRLSNRNSKSSIVKTPKLEEDKSNTSYVSDLEKEISEVLSCSLKDGKSDQIIELSKEALKENGIIVQQPVDPSKDQNNIVYSLVDEIKLQFPELAVIRETWEQLYNASRGIVKDDLLESAEKNEILSEASFNCEEVTKEDTACFSGNENRYYAQSGTNYALHDVIESPVQTLDRNRLSNRNSKSSIVKTPKLEEDKPNTSYVSDIEKEISEVLSCSLKDGKSDQIIELSKEALKENGIIVQQPVNPSEDQNNIVFSLVDEIKLQFPELATIRETGEQLYNASHGIVKDDLLESAEKNEISSEGRLNSEEVIKESTSCFSGRDQTSLKSYGSIERSSKDHNMILSFSEKTIKSMTGSKITETSSKISHVILTEKTSDALSHHSTKPLKSDDSNGISERQYQAYSFTLMREVNESLPNSCGKSHEEQTDERHFLSEKYEMESTNIKQSTSSLNPSGILERGVTTHEKSGTIKCCSDSAIKNDLTLSKTLAGAAIKRRAKSSTIIDIIPYSLSNSPSNSSNPQSSPFDSTSYYNSSWTNSNTEYVTESAV